MIDSCPVDSFDSKILYKMDNKTPRKYSVLLKFDGPGFNNRFYICYDYEFSKLKFSVPEFINNDYEIKKNLVSISEASSRDGGDGAILIKLKNL